MTNIQKCGVIGVGFVGATCALYIGGFRTVLRSGYSWI